MMTVQETTVWNVDHRQPNHHYILSDDGQLAYGYIKWGQGKPQLFNSPMRMDWRYRKYLILHKTKDVDTDTRVWKIAGSKGNEYKVSLKDGEYTCTCPAATFRHSECKHIVQVKESVNGETA